MSRILGCTFLAASAVFAHGQVLLNTSFEASEGYTLNPLSTLNTAQQGWLGLGDGYDLTGMVTGAQAFDGTRSVEVQANQLLATAWWWKDTPLDTAINANKVIRVTWAQRTTAPPGTPSWLNTSMYGVTAYDDNDTVLSGLLVDNYDLAIYVFDPVTDDWAVIAALGVRNQWQRYGMAMNLATRNARFEVNGVTQPEVQTVRGTRNTFLHADLNCRLATTDTAHFDGFRIEAFPSGAIQGTATLEDFTGDATTRKAYVEIRNPGTLTLAEPLKSVSLRADGQFVVSTSLSGTYDLAIRSDTTLIRILPNVPLRDTGTYDLTVALVNGDVDGDNSVTVFDYDRLSSAFDSVPGDAAWDTNADLDGDGSVTVFDYDILSRNFDLTGE